MRIPRATPDAFSHVPIPIQRQRQRPACQAMKSSQAQSCDAVVAYFPIHPHTHPHTRSQSRATASTGPYVCDRGGRRCVARASSDPILQAPSADPFDPFDLLDPSDPRSTRLDSLQLDPPVHDYAHATVNAHTTLNANANVNVNVAQSTLGCSFGAPASRRTRSSSRSRKPRRTSARSGECPPLPAPSFFSLLSPPFPSMIGFEV